MSNRLEYVLLRSGVEIMSKLDLPHFPSITLERLYPHYNNIEIKLQSGSKVVLSKQTGVR